MKNLWQNFNAFGWGLIGATLVLQPTVAQAQYIQRSFLNPSFEEPVFSSACYVQVSPSIIPGWETTHGSVANGTGNCTGYVSPGKVPLIEIWTTGFGGVSTATNAGNQFAELNAEQASELYQNICLIKNETITFSLLHRGRSSPTVADVANFLIGLNTDSTKTIFGTFSTTSNGTVTAQPVAQNGATIPSVSNNNAANGWVRYTGTVPYTGTSGNRPVGFAAVSTAGGDNTVGNFLDQVQFAGLPVVEFTASSGGAAESETNPTTNPPKLRIVGLVPTGGISVSISVSGTAVLGTDYNTTSGKSTFNITIPAGNYDGSDATSVFTIPFTVINNNVPQGSRTIVFTIQPSSSFFTSSTTTCGASPTVISNYTIFDDDFLSGKVWDDADNSANNTFTNINTGSETGTNAGGLLNAILVDNSTNKVLVTTRVATDGTYTFTNVPLNQNNVKIILSTTAGTVGNTAPASSLPSNWVNTSPLTTATFNTGTNISSKDFGIEQLPDTNNVNATSQTNPGGTNQVQVVTISGTDPEDGTLGSGKNFKIVTLPTNGTLYYNGTAVTAGQVITNYDPTKLTIDPNDGIITVSFTYAAIDAAGKEDPTPATVSMPFTAAAVTLSGTVFDDIDGSKLINGTETGTNAGGINAVLVDSANKVVATATVAANGTYTFNNVSANANYTVQITTTIATIGAAPPAITLPSGWVSTGENLNGVVDGTVDSKVSVSVTTTNVTGVNFGIEQVPDTTSLSAASQTNPGGTAKVQVPTLAGTDPEDGALGSGKTFKIVTLPTNGTLTYNGTAVTAGQIISNYNPTLLQLDPNDGTITVSFTYAAIDAAGKEDPTPATVTMPFTAAPVSISGTVFSDADADVTINGSDAGTNAGSANLTIYAVDTAGKVLNKATVAANGTYSLANVPANISVTLRLSNDSTVAIGATAPTASSIPSGWYYTGENKNGIVDGTIATLGNIALTTTTSNLTNQNFGIRQAYSIIADPAPTTCNPDYRTALNTGITAAGGQLAVGANDLNWTAEWIAGPASGPGTPYAPPRPVGTMPAVVVGNIAPGAWINEPANARWISYPFRLSVNSNGYHNDADLDGITGEGSSSFSGPGTSDDVRLKFTSQLTLPSNANTVSISLPVGVAIDNQFVSIKVNGVENLVPTPAANPTAAEYGTLKSINITNGWQAGVNTIEVIVDSGPDRVGFFLGVQATTTQVCTNPNVLLVKRITAINGNRTKNPNDNTPLNTFVDDTTSTRQADDNSPNWKSGYLLGAIDGGKVKPGDEIEYTIYFLNAGSISANTVRVCDRVSANQNFKVSAYGTNKDIQLQLGTSTVLDLTSASDTADRAQLISAGASVPANCYLKAVNDNGTLVIDVTGSTGVPNLTTMPGSTGQGSPNDSYGFLRFITKVKP
ncbi:beta strand repeat-containing protein [Nostoc sp.]|uniref:beta strand repeat-containing protein n=1 Tax=Nostoc sp. TaxID=1180 RepID=UPI002FF794C3